MPGAPTAMSPLPVLKVPPSQFLGSSEFLPSAPQGGASRFLSLSSRFPRVLRGALSASLRRLQDRGRVPRAGRTTPGPVRTQRAASLPLGG